MTLIRHRQPADRVVPEPKMLSSVVVSVSHVVVGTVALPAVVGGAVVGISFTVRPPARVLHSCSMNTMVRFSPDGGRGRRKICKLSVVEKIVKGLTVRLSGNVPLLRMDRSVKLAQQVLNRMVVFPPSPLIGFPLESCRVAVTVMVVTPTETQLPCQQHSAYLATVSLIHSNEFLHELSLLNMQYLCKHRKSNPFLAL